MSMLTTPAQTPPATTVRSRWRDPSAAIGATAAAAVFHNDVSQIIASWGIASTPHTPKAQ
jgi:hypothetical protein